MRFAWFTALIFFAGCAHRENQMDPAINFPNGEVTNVAFAEKGTCLITVNEFTFLNARREKCHTRLRCFRTSDWKITVDSGELSLNDFTLAACDGPVWTAQAKEFERHGRGSPNGGVVIYEIVAEKLRLKPTVVIKPHEGNLSPSAIAQSSAKPECVVHWHEYNKQKLPCAYVVDLGTGKKTVELEDFPTAPREEHFTKTVLEFARDGKHIVSCHPCRPFQLQVHAADTGKLTASMNLDSPATALKYSPNGKMLAALCLDGTVLILATDLSKSVESLKVEKHQNGYQSPQSVVFPNNETLAVINGSNKIEFFDTKNWKSIRTVSVIRNQVNCIASSPNGELVAAGLGRYCTYPTQVRVYEVKSGKLVAELD